VSGFRRSSPQAANIYTRGDIQPKGVGGYIKKCKLKDRAPNAFFLHAVLNKPMQLEI